jgi:hypothetical protein
MMFRLPQYRVRRYARPTRKHPPRRALLPHSGISLILLKQANRIGSPRPRIHLHLNLSIRQHVQHSRVERSERVFVRTDPTKQVRALQVGPIASRAHRSQTTAFLAPPRAIVSLARERLMSVKPQHAAAAKPKSDSPFPIIVLLPGERAAEGGRGALTPLLVATADFRRSSGRERAKRIHRHSQKTQAVLSLTRNSRSFHKTLIALSRTFTAAPAIVHITPHTTKEPRAASTARPNSAYRPVTTELLSRNIRPASTAAERPNARTPDSRLTNNVEVTTRWETVEKQINEKIVQQVERSVREQVERTVRMDSVLAQRLSSHIQSELYRGIVVERERLGLR